MQGEGRGSRRSGKRKSGKQAECSACRGKHKAHTCGRGRNEMLAAAVVSAESKNKDGEEDQENITVRNTTARTIANATMPSKSDRQVAEFMAQMGGGGGSPPVPAAVADDPSPHLAVAGRSAPPQFPSMGDLLPPRRRPRRGRCHAPRRARTAARWATCRRPRPSAWSTRSLAAKTQTRSARAHTLYETRPTVTDRVV